MIKPKALIFSGFGLNCEEETKFAFEKSGALADIVHINDLIDGLVNLEKYQIMAFPGGFSYGDDTGSGNAFANKLKNHLWEKIEKFVEKDHLVIGICNGFQILVNLGLLPALKGRYGQRDVALLHNDTARYVVRWVDLKVQNDSPWLLGIDQISLPIAHGEGKFFASPEVLKEINEQNLVAFRYVWGNICKEQQLKANPNGALEDIAGITDESKRILGMMPHPERNMFFVNQPDWTILQEKAQRTGKKLSDDGVGIKIFQNAVGYFK